MKTAKKNLRKMRTHCTRPVYDASFCGAEPFEQFRGGGWYYMEMADATKTEEEFGKGASTSYLVKRGAERQGERRERGRGLDRGGDEQRGENVVLRVQQQQYEDEREVIPWYRSTAAYYARRS